MALKTTVDQSIDKMADALGVPKFEGADRAKLDGPLSEMRDEVLDGVNVRLTARSGKMSINDLNEIVDDEIKKRSSIDSEFPLENVDDYQKFHGAGVKTLLEGAVTKAQQPAAPAADGTKPATAAAGASPAAPTAPPPVAAPPAAQAPQDPAKPADPYAEIPRIPPVVTGVTPPAAVPAQTTPPLQPPPEAPKVAINFETDGKDLTAAQKQDIKEKADQYKAAGNNGTIFVSGHTDTRGGKDYNLALANQRAEAVKAEFVKNGIAANKIQTRGYAIDEAEGLLVNKQGDVAENRTAQISFVGLVPGAVASPLLGQTGAPSGAAPSTGEPLAAAPPTAPRVPERAKAGGAEPVTEAKTPAGATSESETGRASGAGVEEPSATRAAPAASSEKPAEPKVTNAEEPPPLRAEEFSARMANGTDKPINPQPAEPPPQVAPEELNAKSNATAEPAVEPKATIDPSAASAKKYTVEMDGETIEPETVKRGDPGYREPKKGPVSNVKATIIDPKDSKLLNPDGPPSTEAPTSAEALKVNPEAATRPASPEIPASSSRLGRMAALAPRAPGLAVGGLAALSLVTNPEAFDPRNIKTGNDAMRIVGNDMVIGQVATQEGLAAFGAKAGSALVGRAAIPLAVLVSAVDIADNYTRSDARGLASAQAGVGGAMAGAGIGAGIGMWAFGVGAMPGAIIGGTIGYVGGKIFGTEPLTAHANKQLNVFEKTNTAETSQRVAVEIDSLFGNKASDALRARSEAFSKLSDKQIAENMAAFSSVPGDASFSNYSLMQAELLRRHQTDIIQKAKESGSSNESLSVESAQQITETTLKKHLGDQAKEVKPPLTTGALAAEADKKAFEEGSKIAKGASTTAQLPEPMKKLVEASKEHEKIQESLKNIPLSVDGMPVDHSGDQDLLAQSQKKIADAMRVVAKDEKSMEGNKLSDGYTKAEADLAGAKDRDEKINKAVKQAQQQAKGPEEKQADTPQVPAQDSGRNGQRAGLKNEQAKDAAPASPAPQTVENKSPPIAPKVSSPLDVSPV